METPRTPVILMVSTIHNVRRIIALSCYGISFTFDHMAQLLFTRFLTIICHFQNDHFIHGDYSFDLERVLYVEVPLPERVQKNDHPWNLCV